jgi:hypothetical protein
MLLARIVRGDGMIWAIFAILLMLWLVAFGGGYMFGGLIHLLLVAALAVVVFNLVSRRRVV